MTFPPLIREGGPPAGSTFAPLISPDQAPDDDRIDKLLDLLAAPWRTFTPTITGATTDPTLGTGSTQEGWYLHVGRLVVARGRIIFGTSGVDAGSGVYTIGLPVVARSDGRESPVGAAWLFDSSTTANVAVAVLQQAGTILVEDSSARITDSHPFTWAASDQIRFHAVYESATARGI